MSDLPPPPPPPPGSNPPPPPFQPPPGYLPVPPPPPPSFQPPPGYLPPPPGNVPTDYTGRVPPPYMPVAAVGAGGTLMSQFSGAALWSIGLGIVSIVVPLASNFYFPIMPIIGALNGVRAIQRGRVIGGIVGLVLNAVGGIVSLLASGLIGG